MMPLLTPTFSKDLRATLRLALPVAFVQVGMMAMGLVDTILIGHVSAAALASVAIGNLYFFTVSVFGMGTLFALDPLVAQAIGAGDEEGARLALQRGLRLAALLAVVTSLALLPADWVLGHLGQPADVVPNAARYARACIPGSLPFFAFVVLRQTLQAMHRTRPVVLTMIIGNVANAFFNWVFIFGHLGSKAYGPVGSAWSTTAARWVMALVLLAAGWPELKRYLLPPRAEANELAPLLRMLRLGMPIGAQQLMEVGAFGAIGLLMGRLGTTAVAAHQVALNLASLTFMVPLGVSSAAAVLVGQAVGRGDPDQARRSARAALVCGAGFMTVMALVLLAVPEALAAVYTTDPAVLGLAASLIPIAGVFQVFDGLQVVSLGVLRGVGDTRAPVVINVLGFWCLGIPVSVALGFNAGGGPRGLWWGLVAGLAAVAAVLLWRVRHQLSAPLVRVRV